MLILIAIYLMVFIAGIIVGIIISSASELVRLKGGTLDVASGIADVDDWVFDPTDKRTLVILHLTGKEKKKNE